jgi:hypothetical protein
MRQSEMREVFSKAALQSNVAPSTSFISGNYSITSSLIAFNSSLILPTSKVYIHSNNITRVFSIIAFRRPLGVFLSSSPGPCY